MKWRGYILFLLVALFLNSCYTKRENALLLEKNVPTYEKVAYTPYTIKVNDELRMRVISLDEDVNKLFGGDNTSGNRDTYRVYTDSTIDIPYAKGIKVAGLTLREAQKKLCEVLSEFGKVDVRLVFVNNNFTVIGEAGKGVFNFDKEKITIYQALAMAGDVNITGDHKCVDLIRESEEGTKFYTFDVRSKDIIDSEFYYIQPNDIIYVDRKKSSFWKANSYTGVLGIIASVVSFATTIWYLVDSYKK